MNLKRARHVNMAAYVWMKTCTPLKCIAIVLELVIMVIYVKSMIASIAMRIKRALISISWFPIMQLANAKGPVEHTECTNVKLRYGPYNMYRRSTLDRPRSKRTYTFSTFAKMDMSWSMEFASGNVSITARMVVFAPLHWNNHIVIVPTLDTTVGLPADNQLLEC